MIILCHRIKPSFSIVECHMLIRFDFFPEASCKLCFCNPSGFWFGVARSCCHSIGAFASAHLWFSLHSFCRKRHKQESLLQSHGCVWALGCVKIKPRWVKYVRLEFFIWGRMLCCSCKTGSLRQEQGFFFSVRLFGLVSSLQSNLQVWSTPRNEGVGKSSFGFCNPCSYAV